MGQWLKSVLFTIFLFVSVPIYAPIVLLTAPFPRRVAYRAVLYWVDAQLFMLEKLCGLRYEVEGTEHLPSEPSIVLMKHSSAWETLAQLKLFPRQTWVLKRELMWAPFFGWALMLLKPIAIDRRGGRVAVEQVVTQGRARLDEGLWVVIFPEGTRVPYGQTGRFGLSGALLATAAGKPVIPVAHDAGRYWPRRGWLKRAGTIRVRIGPPISTAGRDPREITAEVRAWIERAVAEIDAAPAARGEQVVQNGRSGALG
ncbi:MAG TPA: lysophospholipid acyltransferase family protein [Gammaproteobacteria bacterium]